MASGMWHRALGAIIDVTRHLQAIGQTIRKDIAQKDLGDGSCEKSATIADAARRA